MGILQVCYVAVVEGHCSHCVDSLEDKLSGSLGVTEKAFWQVKLSLERPCLHCNPPKLLLCFSVELQNSGQSAGLTRRESRTHLDVVWEYGSP